MSNKTKEECALCREHAYLSGGGEPAGCVKCGAHACVRCAEAIPADDTLCAPCVTEINGEAGECGRILGRFSYAGPRHCGKPTAPDEELCPDCMQELDTESQRQHDRDHAAGRL